MLGWKHIDDIAAHTKSAAMEIDFVTLVLHFDETFDHFALSHVVTDAHGQNHLVVLVAVTDTIDTGDCRYDDAITAFQQAFGRRKPHLLDMFIDCRILLNEQVARRNVGFRLVVVVIGNEVLDRVIREKLAEL